MGQKENRWRDAQSKEDTFWKREGVLQLEMQRILSRYAATVAQISHRLEPDSKILDVGCGPTCVGRLFGLGSKTYLDPLMESYLKTHADQLPEGEKICGTAESIPAQDETFDVVLCVNALDHMIDPATALREMRRVLKRGGVFALGIFVHPTPIAFARNLIERYIPFFREDAHPYSFTRSSVRRLLRETFVPERETRVFRKETALIPSLHREDWVYVCRKKV